MQLLKFAVLALALTCVTSAQESTTPQDAKAQPKTPPKYEETIVVTGTPVPIPLEEADRTVMSLENAGSPTVYRNAMDVLQSDPAIDVRQRAPGVQGDLSIRGSSFGQTLVMVNGLRLNDAQTGHNNLDLPFPFSALERAEVLHGSGSTLYGADAVGGAVNFLTATPQSSEVRLSIAGGNFGTNQQNALASVVLGNLSQQLTMTRELSSGFMTGRDYRSLAFGSQSSVETELGFSKLLLGYSDRPFGANQFYGPYPSWERTKGWFVGASQDLGEQTQVAFGYRRHTDIFWLFRERPEVYANDHLTDSYEVALRRFEKVGKTARLYYGAEGYRDSIDSTNLGRRTRDRGAVYANFDVRALRRFSFAVGGREEFFTGGNAEFVPSFTGGYWVNDKVKVRAAVSRAFRLPTYTDLYYRDPANIGNPDLKPESAWSYETGVQLSLGRVTADVAVFHRRDRNVIDYSRTSLTAPWVAMNIGRLNFTGLDAALRWQVGAQRFDVAYTGLTGAQETLEGVQSKYVFNYPTNSARVTWWGHMKGDVQTRVRLGVLQRFERDSYPLVDLSASKQFGWVKPFVQLTNVSNTGYEEIPGVAMPGRAVLAGVELRWVRK